MNSRSRVFAVSNTVRNKRNMNKKLRVPPFVRAWWRVYLGNRLLDCHQTPLKTNYSMFLTLNDDLKSFIEENDLN